MSETFLMAVDDSPASAKALDYLARLVAPLDGAEVHLVHVVPAPDLARVAVGKRTEDEHEAERALLGRQRELLTKAGFPADRVDVGLLAHDPETSLVEGLLDLARDRACETIVVGRNALPWYRETFHHHPADELVRRATGFTIWIVE